MTSPPQVEQRLGERVERLAERVERRLAGAFAHVWVVEDDMAAAEAKARAFIMDHWWVVEELEFAPEETTPEHLLRLDEVLRLDKVEAASSREALRLGAAAVFYFYAGPREARPDEIVEVRSMGPHLDDGTKLSPARRLGVERVNRIGEWILRVLEAHTGAEALREITQLANEALSASDHDEYVAKKVASIQSFAARLYSTPKHDEGARTGEDGEDVVRAHIYADATRLYRWSPRIRELEEQLAAASVSNQFEEERGALFKRRPGGGYHDSDGDVPGR